MALQRKVFGWGISSNNWRACRVWRSLAYADVRRVAKKQSEAASRPDRRMREWREAKDLTSVEDATSFDKHSLLLMYSLAAAAAAAAAAECQLKGQCGVSRITLNSNLLHTNNFKLL